MCNNIAAYIKSRRDRLNLTQTQLADTIGVSNVFISRVESGQKKPGLGLLSAIGVALDCDVGYLRYLLWDAPDEMAGLSEEQWQETVCFVQKMGKK
jgi:transcriptional regulator with XRE-family HTH domain